MSKFRSVFFAFCVAFIGVSAVPPKALALEPGQCVQTINSNLPVSAPKYQRFAVSLNILRLWVLQFQDDTFTCSVVGDNSGSCVSTSGGYDYVLSTPTTTATQSFQTITRVTHVDGGSDVIEASADVNYLLSTNFKFYYTAADSRSYIGYIGAFGSYGWLTTMANNTCPAPVL